MRFHDNSSTDISSTTLRLQTFRLQTLCLLLYTRVQDSYTSNFCFSKSLFSSIPASTYTMIPFINPTSTDTMIIQHIVSQHCGMTIQFVLSVKDYQSHFQLRRIPCINPGSIDIFVSLLQFLFQQGKSQQTKYRQTKCLQTNNIVVDKMSVDQLLR